MTAIQEAELKLRNHQRIFRDVFIERIIYEFRSLEQCALADSKELASIKEQYTTRIVYMKFLETTVDGILGDVTTIGPEEFPEIPDWENFGVESVECVRSTEGKFSYGVSIAEIPPNYQKLISFIEAELRAHKFEDVEVLTGW